MRKAMGKRIGTVIVLLALGGCSAFLANVFSGESIAVIYDQLNLPPYAPPRWLFGPVWSVLYALLALYLVHMWEQNQNPTQKILMYGQLGINLCWTPIFFGFHLYGVAVLMILVMDVVVFYLLFQERSKYRFIFVLYLIWLAIASYLAIGVYVLN